MMLIEMANGTAKRGSNISIELTPRARQCLERLGKLGPYSQYLVVQRIIEFVSTLPEVVQRVAIGMIPADMMGQVIERALREMAARPEDAQIGRTSPKPPEEKPHLEPKRKPTRPDQ